MSSPRATVSLAAASTTDDVQENALTPVSPANGIKASPTFTVSSSSSFTSSSDCSPPNSSKNMATLDIKNDQQHHQQQRLFSYAELLSSPATLPPPFDNGMTSMHTDAINDSHHAAGNNVAAAAVQHQSRQQEPMGQQNSHHSSAFSATTAAADMLPPPTLTHPPNTPSPSNGIGLHPLSVPYPPSSPIARPLQHQQQQQRHHRSPADTAIFDGFGYPYMNLQQQQQQQQREARERDAAGAMNSPAGMVQSFGHLCTTSSPSNTVSTVSSCSSSISRPVTPVSPLLSTADCGAADKMYGYRRNTLNGMYGSAAAPFIGNGDARSAHVPSWMGNSGEYKNESLPPPPPQPRSRGRRVSNVPTHGVRMFTCEIEGCGKVFKRSEHLKRHIRSIHTLEKRKSLVD